jgi:hypothetical protein
VVVLGEVKENLLQPSENIFEKADKAGRRRAAGVGTSLKVG